MQKPSLKLTRRRDSHGRHEMLVIYRGFVTIFATLTISQNSMLVVQYNLRKGPLMKASMSSFRSSALDPEASRVRAIVPADRDGVLHP
eukprot:6199609-Pleurochrysis_carterae.AAC.4